MGTRSQIIVQCRDGKVRSIYCHWDGYLSHNGDILQKHYNSQAMAEALVALGDLSSLGEEIGEKHDFNYGLKLPVDSPECRRLRRMCNVYHRDRGESWADVKPEVFDNTPAAWPDPETWAEFAYVWNLERQCWFVAGAHEGTQALVPLAYALAHPDSIDANVIVPFVGIVGKHQAKPKLSA